MMTKKDIVLTSVSKSLLKEDNGKQWGQINRDELD